jgi:hypothetical protein
MATKAETRDRAANELGLLRLGQSLQYQDQVRIESAYDEVYEQLKEDGLATWASTGSVPTKLVPHVVALVADNCLNTYGVSNDRYTRIKNDSSVAKREIRNLITPDFESLEDPSDF